LEFDTKCRGRGARGRGPDDRASGAVADKPEAADKIRVDLPPAATHNPPMLARVLSAALSRHSLPWETTAEVNGIEASCPPKLQRSRIPVEVEVNCGWGDTLIVILGSFSPVAIGPPACRKGRHFFHG
jgi:hypothetical protein